MVGTGNGSGTERFPKPKKREGKGKLSLSRPGNGKETLYYKFGNVDITKIVCYCLYLPNIRVAPHKPHPVAGSHQTEALAAVAVGSDNIIFMIIITIRKNEVVRSSMV